jgi:hypothetical protein
MKIRQIIPASGWAAIYEDTALPLICWAMYDSDEDHSFFTESHIIGMVTNGDGKVIPAENRSGFKSYDFDPESTSEFLINNDQS